MRPKFAIVRQAMPFALPNFSHLSWLVAGIASATTPMVLADPIPPTNLPSTLESRQEVNIPFHQKVSIRAADLVLNKPDRIPSPLTADKPTEITPILQPSPNSAPEDKQPSDKLEQTVREIENPLVRRISIPIVNRTAFGLGSFSRTANVTSIQPLLPISLGEDYLILRPSIPFIYAPTLSQSEGGIYGLGDLRMQAYFVPKTTGNLIFGIGSTLLFPTASDRTLGFGKWGIGPALAAVWSEGRWTVGGRIENYWSVAGDGGRPDISQLTVNPFVTYTLDDGWYLVSSPVIAAFWNIPSGEKWVVPIGGGIGKIFKIGDRPFNISVQAYWQAIRPNNTEGLALVVQLQSIFPR